jgi:hypothetical protein
MIVLPTQNAKVVEKHPNHTGHLSLPDRRSVAMRGWLGLQTVLMATRSSISGKKHDVRVPEKRVMKRKRIRQRLLSRIQLL